MVKPSKPTAHLTGEGHTHTHIYITYITLQAFSRGSYPERHTLKCINRTRDKLNKRKYSYKFLE